MPTTLTHLLLTLTALALAAAGYAFTCWVSPYRPCARCHATGERTTVVRARPTTCSRCRGTGHHRRAGRAVYHHAARAHTAAHRPARAAR